MLDAAAAGTEILVATPSTAGIARELRMPPRFESPTDYVNWFSLAPRLLNTDLRRADIPEHVMDLVFRRGPTDEARQRMDVAFQNAMAYVTDPRLRTTHAFPIVSD